MTKGRWERKTKASAPLSHPVTWEKLIIFQEDRCHFLSSASVIDDVSKCFDDRFSSSCYTFYFLSFPSSFVLVSIGVSVFSFSFPFFFRLNVIYILFLDLPPRNWIRFFCFNFNYRVSNS